MRRRELPQSLQPQGLRSIAQHPALSWLFRRPEWTIAVLVAWALSLWLNRGALTDPSHTLPRDIWDPSLNAYEIAWGGHALLHDPTGVWNTNAFYPAPYGLAYSDALLGYAPFAFIGTGPEAAILRYNILFIAAQALVLFGGYVLARQLGLRKAGATLVGVALAVAPWRLDQTGHIQIVSSGGILLALAMLARGHGIRWRSDNPDAPRQTRWGWVLGGWLVATWQMCIGFGLGIAFLYMVLGSFLVGIGVWAWRRRAELRARQWPVLDRRVLFADAGGGLLFAGVSGLLAWPYLQVLDRYPFAKRDASWIELYSPPLRGLFTAPPNNYAWGAAHEAARAGMQVPGEGSLLPGFALYALALSGLFLTTWRLSVRLWLAAGTTVFLIFCLGTNGPFGGHLGYLLLLNLPGFEGIRTPGRLIMWATIGLALLAGGALDAFGGELSLLSARIGNLFSPVRMRRAGAVLVQAFVLVPVLLVYLEGQGNLEHPRFPDEPPSLATVAAPYLVLPLHPVMDMNVMLWSTDRFAPVVNGGSGLVPKEQDQVRDAIANFPDQASVDYLRGIGVRSVVVLPDRIPSDTKLAQAATLPIDGLALTRQVNPDAVVFTLSP